MKFVPFYTKTIPVYSETGRLLDEIALPEAIRPGFQRRGGFSDSGVYYKGAGILYGGHLANALHPGLLQTGENRCPYQKYQVLYPHLYGRYGIFTFRHQPVFSDHEGGCGPKENNLLRMQRLFQFSAIDGEIAVLGTPLPGHAIYAYRLKEQSGSYRDTARLLEYVLTEDFNCPWDKSVWNDISGYGWVRDLADWFLSKEARHKLGTAYAFLSAILAADRYLYFFLAKALTGWEQLEPAYLPFVAARIVERFCPGCLAEYDPETLSAGQYEFLLNLLYDGKACCHLEDEAAAPGFREECKKLIPGRVQAMETLLMLQERGC